MSIEPSVNHDVKYVDYVPFYSLKAACGYFGEGEDVQETGWINVSGHGKLNRNMFVVRACGNSMEPRIKDGDYCLFRSNVVGSRNGKIVLVQQLQFQVPQFQAQKQLSKFLEQIFQNHLFQLHTTILQYLQPLLQN